MTESPTLHIVCPHCHTTNRVREAQLASAPDCGSTATSRCSAPTRPRCPTWRASTATSRATRSRCWSTSGPRGAPRVARWAPAYEQAAAQLELRVRVAIGRHRGRARAGRALQHPQHSDLALFKGGREVARLCRRRWARPISCAGPGPTARAEGLRPPPASRCGAGGRAAPSCPKASEPRTCSARARGQRPCWRPSSSRSERAMWPATFSFDSFAEQLDHQRKRERRRPLERGSTSCCVPMRARLAARRLDLELLRESSSGSARSEQRVVGSYLQEHLQEQLGGRGLQLPAAAHLARVALEDQSRHRARSRESAAARVRPR